MVPSPGLGRDHERQAQLASKVTHQVAERQRHQQPTHPLDHENVRACCGAPRGCAQPRGIDLGAGQLRAEVRGHGLLVAVGGDLVVRLSGARGAAEQGVVRLDPGLRQAARRRA